MYLTFYGLNEKPFNTTPDPKFLYLTPGHREALAQLVYSVRENRGFLVLTGEVGTGKTTLLQAFLRRLDGKAAVAYVFNSMLPFEGLLEYVLEELKVPEPGSSPAQRLLALRRFMLDRRRAGQSTVLVLDEAQNLDVPTLERIRMLSNFETPTEKLLQILLVGQPELRAKLQRPELRGTGRQNQILCAARLRLYGPFLSRLYPDPPPCGGRARSRPLQRPGSDPDRQVLARDPATRQHFVRSLPRHRVRRPAASDRGRRRRPGHRGARWAGTPSGASDDVTGRGNA